MFIYIIILSITAFLTVIFYFPYILIENSACIQSESAIPMLKGILDVISVLIGFWGIIVVFFLNSITQTRERLEKEQKEVKERLSDLASKEDLSAMARASQKEDIRLNEVYLKEISEKIKKLQITKPRIIYIMLLLIIFFAISIFGTIYCMGLAVTDKLRWLTFLVILILFEGDLLLLFDYIYILHNITD